MTKLFLLFAAAVTTVAGPAFAREAKPAEPAAETQQPAASAPKAQVRERQYCIVETATGSHIPQKTCKTRADWLQEGFDPTAH